MTTVTKTLKLAGGDYSDPILWEATEQTDLVADGDSHVLECDAGTYDFGTGVKLRLDAAGWTTSASNTITIKAATGHEHNGVVGAGVVFQTNYEHHQVIELNNLENVYITGLELVNTNSSSVNSCGGLAFSAFTEVTDCIFRVPNNTSLSNNSYGMSANGNGNVVKNCIVIGAGSGTTSGFRATNWAACTITSCTAIDCGYGFNRSVYSGRVMALENCFAYNSSIADFATADAAGISLDYCASEDTTASTLGTNAVTGVTSADMVDYAGGDYRPTSSGALAGAGPTPPPIATDITGATRNDPDDIGAFKAAGGPILVKEMYVKDSNAFVNAAPNLRIGGAWQEVEAHVRSGGVWVKVHDK